MITGGPSRLRRFAWATALSGCAIAFTPGTPAAAQEMDNATFHYSLLELDASSTQGPDVFRWGASGWIGNDFDRLWWSTEGEGYDGELGEVEMMALYGHYFRRFWDFVVGYRHDLEPTSQGYLTIGLMGLAPYWFEVGLFGFVNDKGKPSLRLDAEQDLLITQRLILTLEGELDWLLTSDEELDLDAGASALKLGIRTRYEIRRKFAPYLDLTWVREGDPRTPEPGHTDVEGLRFGVGVRLIH